MKYCSIDIETTGLDIEKCEILQFACVIDDLSDPKPIEQLPKFQAMFIQNYYTGDPAAFAMHSDILKTIDIARKKKLEECPTTGTRFFTDIDEFPTALEYFLSTNGFKPSSSNGKYYVTAAGKNVASFDLPFLKSKIKNWQSVYWLARTIDPAILYLDYEKDIMLPDMKTCMVRAGLEGEVAHTALEDAVLVVKLLRHKLLNKDVKKQKRRK